MSLDDLHFAHLNALDIYQSQIQQLSKDLSNGFLALAAANVAAESARGAPYGRKMYEQKPMTATRGVRISEKSGSDINELVWEDHELQSEPNGPQEVSSEKPVEQEGLRRRRGKDGGSDDVPRGTSEDNDVDADADEDKKTTDNVTDNPTEAAIPQKKSPLTLFHPLPPPALRAAGTAFSTAIKTLPELASTLHDLRVLANQIEAMSTTSTEKYIYKLLTESPAWPMELSQLDQSSGYIHLCTEQQALGVMTRFMGGFKELWALKIPVERLGEKDLRWELVDDVNGERFPHLYGELKEHDVESAGKVERDQEGQWRWEEVKWE
jgi:uncharacterized protein (DUF952 family)